MVDIEPASRVVDLPETSAITMRLRQDQVNVNVVWANFVDRTEAHSGVQRDSRLHRMELKGSDLPVLCQEMPDLL